MTESILLLNDSNNEPIGVCRSISSNETIIYFDPTYLNQNIRVQELTDWLKLLMAGANNRYYAEPFAIDRKFIKDSKLSEEEKPFIANQYVGSDAEIIMLKTPSKAELSTITFKINLDKEIKERLWLKRNPRFFDKDDVMYHQIHFVPFTNNKTAVDVYKELQKPINDAFSLQPEQIENKKSYLIPLSEFTNEDGQYHAVEMDEGDPKKYSQGIVLRQADDVIKIYYKASTDSNIKMTALFPHILNQATGKTPPFDKITLIDHSFEKSSADFTSVGAFAERNMLSVQYDLLYNYPLTMHFPNHEKDFIEIFLRDGTQQKIQFIPLSTEEEHQVFEEMVGHHVDAMSKVNKFVVENKLTDSFPQNGSNSREKIFKYDQFCFYDVKSFNYIVMDTVKLNNVQITTHNTRTTGSKYKTNSVTYEFRDSFQSVLWESFRDSAFRPDIKALLPKIDSKFSYKLHTINIKLHHKIEQPYLVFIPAAFKEYKEQYDVELPYFSTIMNVSDHTNKDNIGLFKYDEVGLTKTVGDGMIRIDNNRDTQEYVGYQLTEKNKFGRRHVDIYKFNITNTIYK